MTVYTRNQPVATDDLDVSQPILLANTNAADSVFGFDHYAFSNTTANQGFHNTVNTPAYSSNFAVPTITTTPPATTTNPILYAFQPIDGSGNPTTNIGVLQYSRGTSSAVPTPVTALQSPVSGISLLFAGTTPVLNFSGISGAVAMLYIADYSFSNQASIYFINWGGSSFYIAAILTGGYTAFASGSTLSIRNNGNNTSGVRWTLQFLRTE